VLFCDAELKCHRIINLMRETSRTAQHSGYDRDTVGLLPDLQ
jgi:hypothetical protein